MIYFIDIYDAQVILFLWRG